MRQTSIEIEGLHHDAPIPVASRIGPILATSAISGEDRHGGGLPPDADGQARNAFDNLGAILAASGLDFGDVVRLTVYLADEAHRHAINTYWLQHFPDPAHRPARHSMVAPIRRGRLLQIEALAVAKTLA